MKVFSLLNCNIRTYLIIYSSFFEDYDDGNDDDGDDDNDGGDDDQATVNWGLYGDTPQLGGAWKHFA